MIINFYAENYWHFLVYQVSDAIFRDPVPNLDFRQSGSSLDTKKVCLGKNLDALDHLRYFL
jgi:hypothetical protein